ncbi:hypothetical protein RRG08_028341 [Elysia crispata]|uniref:Uncharacterized protein n=1 Tax=Elysia crispata TaxID=231223 RepID=A0AAE1AW41_9GAST|nr:hypothetical protein RRG08_028341 [Elysia crispata]
MVGASTVCPGFLDPLAEDVAKTKTLCCQCRRAASSEILTPFIIWKDQTQVEGASLRKSCPSYVNELWQVQRIVPI